jgi:hypothetical protein
MITIKSEINQSILKSSDQALAKKIPLTQGIKQYHHRSILLQLGFQNITNTSGGIFKPQIVAVNHLYLDSVQDPITMGQLVL